MNPKAGGTRKIPGSRGAKASRDLPRKKMFVLEGPPTPSFPLRELGGGESDVSHN
jgi:hypothetical protein